MYCSKCGKPIGEEALFCPFCGNRTASAAPQESGRLEPGPARPFARYSSDKKIAGVCGGVARYFGLDASLVRAIWALCVLLYGVGVLVYVVLWIAMPLDPAPPA